MTLEQYKAKLDEELKAMDWHERDIKNSRAYKVLSAAALDRDHAAGMSGLCRTEPKLRKICRTENVG